MNSSLTEGQPLIWVVVLAYMGIISAAGAYYGRYMRTADAYFNAGNLIPWWAAGISMYMANFTAYTFVGIASLVYMRGMPGILLETGPALAFGFGAIFLARRWHRLNLTSPPEYLEARFNGPTRQAFSLLGILSRLLGNGIRLLSMCKFLEAVTGIPAEATIVVTGAVVIFYTVLGGLWAVIVTDVLQFVILFLAVIPMLVISTATIFLDGTWAEFVGRLPEGFASFPNTNPEALYPGVPVSAAGQWGWLAAFWFSYLLDYNGDWGVIQRMCCTPTEKDARKAIGLATILSIPHAALLLGCCFIARGLWGADIADPNNVQDAEMIYGRIAAHILPAGLIGVVAAAMFSATMSTLNVSWAVMSTSFVNDVYRRVIRPGANDRELILAGRIAVAAVGVIAVVAALAVALTETDIFALAQSLVVLVVVPSIVPLLLGILMRHTHEYGALAGLVATLVFGILNKTVLGWPFGVEILASASVCFLTMWGSGFVGRNDAYSARLDTFFARMRAPRPAPDTTVEVPAPLPVVGVFMMLIGVLVLLLVFTPQSGVDRVVTFAASVVLLAVGFVLRRTRKRLGGVEDAS